MKVGKIAKNVGMTLVLPVAVYLLFFLLCNVITKDHGGFGIGSDFSTLLYSATYWSLMANAMNLNLQTGRFDFSQGATMLLSGLMAGKILNQVGITNPILMILMMCAFGVIIGIITGNVYIWLKLPPMVVTIGLAMIYEAVGFMLCETGLKFTNANMLIWAKFPYDIILMVVVLAILVVVYDFTAIGYNRRALMGGQKITTDVGVNEKRNAVICFLISGGLLGLAAAVRISYQGMVSPSTGLGSTMFFMSAFLPMFVGQIFGRYSSVPIGIFMGGFVQACIDNGLAHLNVNTNLCSVINGVIVCLFLIYSSNAYRFERSKRYKAKLAKAVAAAEAK